MLYQSQNISTDQKVDVVFECVKKDFSSQQDPNLIHTSFLSNTKTQYIFLYPPERKGIYKEEKYITIGDGSEVEMHSFYFGGDEVAMNTKIQVGRKARVHSYTYFFVSGRQKFDIQEFFELKGEESYARFFARGITSHEAESSYLGNIHVSPQAQKTDSRLDIRSFLLGVKAKSSMSPKLEIEANNVKAGHAATVSHMDEESLFYLRSRGIQKEKALELFIEGVFLEAMVKIQDARYSEILSEKIKEKITASAGL